MPFLAHSVYIMLGMHAMLLQASFGLVYHTVMWYCAF